MSFIQTKLNHLCWFLRRSSSLSNPNLSTSAAPPDDLDSFPASDADPPLAIEIHDVQYLESPDSTTEVDVAAIHNIPQASRPVSAGRQDILAVPRLNPVLIFDLGGVVIGLCLTSAVEIALQSLQPNIEIPFLFHLFALALVFAFSSFFVSNFFSADYPRFSHALVQVGKLCVFMAFFLAITVPFSVPFKIILWSICVLSLLAIAYTVAASGRLRP